MPYPPLLCHLGDLNSRKGKLQDPVSDPSRESHGSVEHVEGPIFSKFSIFSILKTPQDGQFRPSKISKFSKISICLASMAIGEGSGKVRVLLMARLFRYFRFCRPPKIEKIENFEPD